MAKLTCNACDRDLTDTLELQEALNIEFRGGFGSVFGDGNIVRGLICQHCVKDAFGAVLSITEDDPINPKHALHRTTRITQSQPDQNEALDNIVRKTLQRQGANALLAGNLNSAEHILKLLHREIVFIPAT